MKILDGRELAGFIKERQAQVVRNRREEGLPAPKLLIIRDSENPVIVKYVNLKKQYGEDIGVEVEDKLVEDTEEAKATILAANKDVSVSGIIVQLPLKNVEQTDEVVNLIATEKDVDGLATHGDGAAKDELGVAQKSGAARKFESATATAIHWLLNGYGIELGGKKVALVGYGRLVGRPLKRMWENSGIDVTVFRHDSDLSQLRNFDVIVSATGVPHLIKNEMVKPGAVVVDAGTASEDGVLVGDVDDAVRERDDLTAITPRIGGVGPLTVSVLFEDVIAAAA